MKKIIVSGLILLCLLSVCVGCGKKGYTETEIKSIFAEQLSLKYHLDFDIQGVNTQEDGTHKYYLDTVVDKKSGTEFTAHIEKDGTGLKDNFEGFYYDETFQQEIDNIIDNVDDDVFITDYVIYYLMSEVPNGNIDAYRESGNLKLRIDVTIDALDNETTAKKLMAIVEQCREKGFLLSVNLSYDTIPYVFYESAIYRITYEDIVNKLANVQEIE